MRIIKPSVEIMDNLNQSEILNKIELCGRVCYKSEDMITDESAETFVKRIIESGHHSVLEHVSFTVKFICDRGVSHEIVRHRIASYSQESTRYCNYGKDGFGGEITVIEPCFLALGTIGYGIWHQACKDAEEAYFEMLNYGCSPQEARSVLPNSLKTEIMMTANLREWLHFIKLRTSPKAHPQMREVVKMLQRELRIKIPVIFGGADNV